MSNSRRNFVIGAGGAAALLGTSVFAQQAGAMKDMPGMSDVPAGLSPDEIMQMDQRAGLYVALADPKVKQLPADVWAQRFTYSSAPAASPAGRWGTAAPLPIPRSEMAWATTLNDRMHIVGGYGEARVDRTYHHVFDPATGAWSQAAPIPRGANHIGVASDAGIIYAFGGFVGRNRIAVPDCYAYVAADDKWHAIQPLSVGSRGAISVVAFEGRIHAIGGRDVRSVDWHEVYDPKTDSWSTLAPIPGARDHSAAVVVDGMISVVGGRMDTFDFNTGMHVAYDAKRDKWLERAPMPTARSGHGGVLYQGKLFCMGGEGSRRVFGQTEGYDPATDRWQSYAAMRTPRHGMGAATVGGAIHVAGGGPMNGGFYQTSLHEVFTI
jgi:N-acetylneuraminic acid mutarotase